MPHSIDIRPALQTRAAALAHPAFAGRSRGYAQEFRDLCMAVRAAGESRNPLIMAMRQQHRYPVMCTEIRWQHLLNRLGHYRPCRRTGNNRATVLRDHDQILLALYRVAYPKATAAEINAFLYRANYGSTTFRFYAPCQIRECEKRIGLTRKVGSTTAYQALLARNKRKRWAYWNLPYPHGIADIRRRDLIDLDECSVELATGDRSIGKAYIGKRVEQAGLYSKSDKWNLLLCIQYHSGHPPHQHGCNHRRALPRGRNPRSNWGYPGLRSIFYQLRVLGKLDILV
ncbi:hypothetical protein ACHAWF_015603 [Thalassiosira exigua]